MSLAYRTIVIIVIITFFITCSIDPDCNSSNICSVLQDQTIEATIPLLNDFLEDCTSGSEKSDLQPLADWLQTQSCIEQAEVRQQCLYSNPLICFIDLILPDHDSIKLAIEMSRPAKVKYLE